MTKRIGVSDIAFAGIRAFYRRFTVDLGAPARALTLSTPRSPVFTALPKTLPLGNVENGLKILDGRFALGSQSLDIGTQGNPWLVPSPSEPFARQLHSFQWLNDISAIRFDTKRLRKTPKLSEKAGLRARQFTDSWIQTFGKWNAYAWENEILVNRVLAWFANWQVLLETDADTPEGFARRASLYRQLKRIRSTYKRTPAGLPRMKAAACLVLAGACFAGKQDGFLDRGLDYLDDEIETQILPDGGHISRSPQQVVEALEILTLTENALETRGLQGSKEIRRAIDRMMPMVEFFSAQDKTLFGFNGGGRSVSAHIKTLFEANATQIKGQTKNKPRSKPFGFAPHTKFQRLERNGTIIMIDVGESPPRPYDLEAHLAPLALEMSTDAGRLLVNCGWNGDQPQHWREPMRETAAHTGLILNAKSAGQLQKPGFVTRVLGTAIRTGAGPVKCLRKEQDTGTWLEASHDGYRTEFGVSHMRRIYMDLIGSDIRGEDSLYVPLGEIPMQSGEIPFEIRFHFHPDVKVTLAQDQKSALLIQPGGHGWRFRTDGGPLQLEKSVYLADGNRPQRTEQIVIYGKAYGDGDGQTRSNRVRWSLKRLGGVDTKDLMH